jgi:tetratricopeptide (TPR) repeat protein
VVTVSAGGALQHVELPIETELNAGEAEPVPDWLIGTAVAAFSAPVAATAEELPEWLQASTTETTGEALPDWLQAPATADDAMPDWLSTPPQVDVSDDMPAWLTETLPDEYKAVEVPSAPTLSPVPSTPSRAISPAPVPPRAAAINVSATLQAARQHISSNQIDEALLEYEAIVRANSHLSDVVQDLNKLIDKGHKKNPAIYRVLGDGLMRQGNLQQALETYRKALNML